MSHQNLFQYLSVIYSIIQHIGCTEMISFTLKDSLSVYKAAKFFYFLIYNQVSTNFCPKPSMNFPSFYSGRFYNFPSHETNI